ACVRGIPVAMQKSPWRPRGDLMTHPRPASPSPAACSPPGNQGYHQSNQSTGTTDPDSLRKRVHDLGMVGYYLNSRPVDIEHRIQALLFLGRVPCKGVAGF